jgi:DNA-binding MarR family transcriptional regulator
MSEANPTRPDVQAVVDLVEDATSVMLAGGPGAGWMDSELTLGQLRFIHELGRRRSLSIGGVAGHLGVTLTTASQFVDRLERAGYVERVHRSDDRRVVECRLTPRGLDLVAGMRGMQRDGLARVMSLLEPDELRDMGRLFRIIAERVSAINATASTAASPEEVTPNV